MTQVIFGSNGFLVQQRLRELIQKYDGAVEQFDAAELATADSVIDAVRSISLFDPKKLVVVHDFTASSELVDRIEYVVSSVADSNGLALVSNKLDKRSAAYKWLQKNVHIHEEKQLEQPQLMQWLTDQANKHNINISTANARYLCERTGNSQQLLYHDLAKLQAVSGEITKQIIDDLVPATPQSSIFTLLEALFDGQLKRAWYLYQDQRAQGEDPYKIMAMIVWQLQQITMAVYAPDNNQATLTAAGMSPYAARKVLGYRQKVSKECLREYIAELAHVDLQSKTSADVESALEYYFCRIAIS